MASLAGKIVSITGAASGMGKAFARLAAVHGAKLSLADIQDKPLNEFTSELKSSGTDVKSTVLDVASHTSVSDWINDTVKHYGRLDCSANVAGILGGHPRPFLDTPKEAWDRIIGVNLFGMMNCVHAQLKVMESGSSIVNFASVLGTHSMANNTVYSISKHGVVGLTKNAAKEVAGRNIRINVVAPGAIVTPMMHNNYDGPPFPEDQLGAYIPLARYGQPEEIAKVVAFLLSEDSSYMNGHVTYIDGGLVC